VSAYDPFTDDSAHVSVGRVQMRIGYLAHCLGIPASTLAGLRDGSLVAVRKSEMTDPMMDAGQSYLDERALSGWFRLPGTFNWHEFWQHILAATEPPRHD